MTIDLNGPFVLVPLLLMWLTGISTGWNLHGVARRYAARREAKATRDRLAAVVGEDFDAPDEEYCGVCDRVHEVVTKPVRVCEPPENESEGRDAG